MKSPRELTPPLWGDTDALCYRHAEGELMCLRQGVSGWLSTHRTLHSTHTLKAVIVVTRNLVVVKCLLLVVETEADGTPWERTDRRRTWTQPEVTTSSGMNVNVWSLRSESFVVVGNETVYFRASCISSISCSFTCPLNSCNSVSKMSCNYCTLIKSCCVCTLASHQCQFNCL